VARGEPVTTIDDEALSRPELALKVDGWLAELGVEPIERASREGVESWDLILDGGRRRGIRVTVILDPEVALVCWVHYAPPLNDSFRVSYKKLLRWNDELPFVKFALGTEEQPVLAVELPIDRLDRDVLGTAVARLLAVCDLLLADSVRWLWPGAKAPPPLGRERSEAAVLARYRDALGEIGTSADEEH
jgi:Putative bacterial sensory transduction regulator